MKTLSYAAPSIESVPFAPPRSGSAGLAPSVGLSEKLEPSSSRRDVRYGTSRTSRDVRLESAKWGKADIDQVAVANCDFMSTRPTSPVSRGGALCSWARGRAGGIVPPPTSVARGTQRVLISVCQKYLGPRKPEGPRICYCSAR